MGLAHIYCARHTFYGLFPVSRPDGLMYMYLIEFLLKENLKAMLTTFSYYLSHVNVSVVIACSRLTRVCYIAGKRTV